MSFEVIEKQLDEAAVDTLVKSISIPPRPSLLEDIQQEMKKDDPDMRRIASIAGRDVALSAAVMRVVNSPFFGLSRRAETMDQAVAMLGLRQMGALITGMVAREAIKGDGPSLTRFWDVSTKRSFAMQHLARKLRGVEPDIAQTFGLFCDLGIPLLSQRFPDYMQTLAVANLDETRSFTAVEQEKHKTDHALIGALMARTWGLSQTVALAIRVHHDYSVFNDVGVPTPVRRLVAMGVLAERIIQRYAGLNRSAEWEKGGTGAMELLDIIESDLDELSDSIHDAFNAGV
jgi:HD-like signal output (HDOD) protein